jgi:formate/nitrite transporter FocA (FNT family)
MKATFSAVGIKDEVLGRSELFTEHTTAAVLPVLAKRASIGKMLRLWGLILFGNVVGGAIFAWAATQLGPRMGIIKPHVFGEMAHKMIDSPSNVMFISAIAAGWLMGLMTWLTTASRETTGQIIIIWLIAMIIGMATLHHSVAGTIEVLMGLFAGQGVSSYDFFRFLLWSVLGNIIGGSVFVGLLKFGHVNQS